MEGVLDGNTLQGKKVAVLATEGFERVELLEPRKALVAEGAQAVVVSPMKDKIRGWNQTEWGQEVKVDLALTRPTQVISTREGVF